MQLASKVSYDYCFRHSAIMLTVLVLLQLSDAAFSQPILPLPAPTRRSNTAPQHPQRVNKIPGTGRFAIAISEDFLDQLIDRKEINQGPVRDVVLGAQIVGHQQTVATTSLRVIPCDHAARLSIDLKGTTTNATTNYTPQAAIRSCGTYRFDLSKQIEFDGNVMSTWSPSAQLTVDQKNLDATTRLAAFPFLERFASQTALNAANQRQPWAEQIAAHKVTRQVAPEFNTAVDQKISELNRHWQSVKRGQFPFDIAQLNWNASSTETELILQATLANANSSVSPASQLLSVNSSGHMTDFIFACDAGIVNHLVQRLKLAGRRFTDSQLKRLAQGDFSNFSNDSAPQLLSITFDDEQPVHIKFHNGAIELQSRFSVQPVLGQPLPESRLTIQLVPVLQNQELTFEAELIDFSIEQESDAAPQIPLDIIETKLQDVLDASPLPRSFRLPFAINDQAPWNATFTSIELAPGRLQLRVDIETSDSPDTPSGKTASY